MSLFDLFGKKKPSSNSASAATTSPRPTPPRAQEMSVRTLKTKLEHGETPLIIDVREDWEYELTRLAPAKHIPMNAIPQRLAELDKNAEVVVLCHHGGRSWSVAQYLIQNGFSNVHNLTGGIDAWARQIDRTMQTY